MIAVLLCPSHIPANAIVCVRNSPIALAGPTLLSPPLFRAAGILVPGDFKLHNSGSLSEYLLPPGTTTTYH